MTCDQALNSLLDNGPELCFFMACLAGVFFLYQLAVDHQDREDGE
jgi:hypothetical protein